MKSFSTSEAAQIAGISRATIMRLIDQGHIPYHREPGRPQHGAGIIKIDATRSEIKTLVAKHSPLSGYRQRRTQEAERKAKRIIAEAEKQAAEVKPFNGEAHDDSAVRGIQSALDVATETFDAVTSANPVPTLESKLGALAEWAAIPPEKRQVLIQLGAKYDVADLEILANL